MGAEKDLNQPQVYAEALVRAALEPDVERLAAWLAGVGSTEGIPFANWYRHFAEKLIDLAPKPEGGFRPQPRFNSQPPKVGRNDPCPCGSGKKFKACHLGEESVVAWKLGAPTPPIRALAIGHLAHALPVERLDRVPRAKASDVALTEMAAAYLQHGELHKALACLKFALDGERDDPHVVYDYWIARYAEWLVEDGQTKAAEEFLLDEYDSHRGVEQWQVAQKLAAFYIDQGDPDNGQTWVESALEGDPENPFTHYLNGLLFHSVEQWDKAVAAYERAQGFSDRFQDQERQMMLKLVEESLERARNQQPVEDAEEGAESGDEAADAILAQADRQS